MREFDALAVYPQPREPRQGRPSILNRIIASERGREFYDGARENGYGGYVDDGRWGPVAEFMAREYELGVPNSMQGLAGFGRVLQIGCDKGFLLAAFQALGVAICGTEVSSYAYESINAAVKPFVRLAEPWKLPFEDHSCDLVLAIGPVYTLDLGRAIACLREIMRVSRGKAFVTLGAYETESDYWALRNWSLLGTTILRNDEWLEVLRYAGYEGDYKFVTAKSLGLA